MQKEAVTADTVGPEATEQKQRLCNKCCWLLSSPREGRDGDIRESHSRGLAAIPEDLLAKVTAVTRGPCFPGWGPEKLLRVCLLRSSVSASAGRGGGHQEGYTPSRGPLVAPGAQLLGGHTTAPGRLASTCGFGRSPEASFLVSPCCRSSWGRLSGVTA